MAVDPITPPANVTYGTVNYQGAGIHIDQGDVGTVPDYNAVGGTITFTASKTLLKDLTATPNPIGLYPRPFVAGVGTDGYLTTPDGTPAYAGVTMPATDNVNLGSFLWRADFDLVDAFGLAIVQPGFWFELATGASIDLMTVVHINPATGLPEDQAVMLTTTTATFAADIAAAPVGTYLWNTDTDDIVRKDS